MPTTHLEVGGAFRLNFRQIDRQASGQRSSRSCTPAVRRQLPRACDIQSDDPLPMLPACMSLPHPPPQFLTHHERCAFYHGECLPDLGGLLRLHGHRCGPRVRQYVFCRPACAISPSSPPLTLFTRCRPGRCVRHRKEWRRHLFYGRHAPGACHEKHHPRCDGGCARSHTRRHTSFYCNIQQAQKSRDLNCSSRASAPGPGVRH